MKSTGLRVVEPIMRDRNHKYRGGVLCAMQVALAALELANAVVADDAAALEAACLLGLVPAVMRYCFSAWPTPLRAQAANFVHALCYTSLATARMFVACQVRSHAPIAAGVLYPRRGCCSSLSLSALSSSRSSIWSSESQGRLYFLNQKQGPNPRSS